MAEGRETNKMSVMEMFSIILQSNTKRCLDCTAKRIRNRNQLISGIFIQLQIHFILIN